jgi:hypothetical protein
MGQIEAGWRLPDVRYDDVQDGLHEVDSPFGRVRAAAPAERMSQTPAFYARPPVPIGSDAPRWED